MSDPTLGRRMDYRPPKVSSKLNLSMLELYTLLCTLCRVCTFRQNASRKTEETSGILKTCCTNDLGASSTVNAFTIVSIVCTYTDQKSCICSYLFSHVTDKGPTEYVLQNPLQSCLTHWARTTEQPQLLLILIHLIALQLWGEGTKTKRDYRYSIHFMADTTVPHGRYT